MQNENGMYSRLFALASLSHAGRERVMVRLEREVRV